MIDKNVALLGNLWRFMKVRSEENNIAVVYSVPHCL
jgi:hypothetical protein